MERKYSKILKHIPTLEDHGHLYMYYGDPYSEECYVYDDEKDGKNLIVSYECDNLCKAIADEFQYEYEWLDIVGDNNIKLEEVFNIDVETQELNVIIALLLYLVGSIPFEDKFIDALNNGYLLRMLKRLEHLSYEAN
ncbi:protein of unknown function [Tepidanaerobacter acetatoxydans Re1]|uniref:Uncharacterized protein n=1 Tax=Tepidanaerobacter acetatoxydans (strain DSM 21804 / JCM 16047 / Re1) TaxID=1209989 RepID=U4Q8G9_TEPAE|nr:hypothetical protein [Tepidanaerobacter acetatoxydans]CDI40557.1 protein of unknown function [Tepidanaerobacter acetatoxydans Re1]